MKKLINLLIFALFVLSASVAVYIVINSAAPWKLIATYWITLAVKNGLDALVAWWEKRE